MAAIDWIGMSFVLVLAGGACIYALILACRAWRERPIVTKEHDGFRVRRDLRRPKGGGPTEPNE